MIEALDEVHTAHLRSRTYPFGARPFGIRSAAFAAAVVTAAGLVANGPAQAAAPSAGASATTQLGERRPLVAGYAQSWVRRDAAGNVVAFGVSFDETSLASLGAKETEVLLVLPSSPNLPFRTAVIDSNPQGHPPAHVYDVPHFDFHFYTIDEATRMAISPSGAAANAVPPRAARVVEHSVTLSLSKGVARNARCLSSSKASWHARLDELGETRARFDKLSVTWRASTSSA